MACPNANKEELGEWEGKKVGVAGAWLEHGEEEEVPDKAGVDPARPCRTLGAFVVLA